MVEAAGVEPASEKTFNRELSCFFRFVFVSSPSLRTDKDATATSLIGLARPAQAEQGRASLLCDDWYPPVGEAEAIGYLVN